jgi:hypothetical protein
MAQATRDGEREDATASVDAVAPQRTHTGPLLIAGEDAEYTRGALHVAELLARRDRVNVHVLGAVRPLTFPATLLGEADREAMEEGRRLQHLDRIRQRLHQSVGMVGYFTV